LFSMELGLSDQAYQEYATSLGLNVQSFLEAGERPLPGGSPGGL
jgi:hypothetical protein